MTRCDPAHFKLWLAASSIFNLMCSTPVHPHGTDHNFPCSPNVVLPVFLRCPVCLNHLNSIYLIQCLTQCTSPSHSTYSNAPFLVICSNSNNPLTSLLLLLLLVLLLYYYCCCCCCHHRRSSLNRHCSDVVYCRGGGRFPRRERLDITGVDSCTGRMSFLSPNQQCQSTHRSGWLWVMLSESHTAYTLQGRDC